MPAAAIWPKRAGGGKARPRLEKIPRPVPKCLVILLLIATAISAGLWLYERDSVLPYEAIAIFAVVLLNAVMGYIQESRAEEAVAALRQDVRCAGPGHSGWGSAEASRRPSWCPATSSWSKKATRFPPTRG